MKQLHNIVAPLILFCLMAAVSLPVLAHEQEGEAVAQQTQGEITPKEEQENTVDVKKLCSGILATPTNGILQHGVTRILLYRYLLLFIVALRVGTRSFLPVSKRMEVRMKDFPSLPQEANMKANW